MSSRSASTTMPWRSTTTAGWSVPVREAIKVLLVDGDPKTEPFRLETDFLSVALNPEAGDTGESPSPIDAEVATESQICPARPDPLRRGRPLQRRPVHRGRGRGARRLPEAGGRGGRLRRRSGRAGELQPAPLQRRQGPPARRRSGRRWATRRGRRSRSSSTRWTSSTRSSPRSQGESAGVIASLTERQDRAVSQAEAAERDAKRRWPWPSTTATPRSSRPRKYRGKVIQVATSADTGWTSWPLHQSYPPVMEQIVAPGGLGPARPSGTCGSASRSSRRFPARPPARRRPSDARITPRPRPSSRPTAT